MGIRILMKSLVPVKRRQELKKQSDGITLDLPEKGATAPNQDIIPGAQSLDSGQDTPVICETTAALQKAKGKLNKEIMNIFVEEEVAAFPTRKLAAGLPEIPMSVIYKECRECLNRIRMLLRR